MRSLTHIGPEGEGGSSGGGGPEDPGRPRIVLRSQGLLTLAFGFALGIALITLFWLIKWFDPGSITGMLPGVSVWQIFISGLIGGTLIAGIYNLLVLRRLNLFGLEASLD